MKKLLKRLLALSLIVAITGCSSSKQTTNTQLDAILEAGKIVVANEGTYSPYAYHDSNDDLVGYDVEVAKAIAEKLGVEVEFIETEWDGIIAGLDAEKYDIIINQVSITAEREEKYLFSTPYTYAYGAVIVKEENDSIKSFDDLKDKKLAQTTTSNWAATVESYGAEIVASQGFDQSIELVLQGRADATMNDNVTYLDYKNTKPNSKVKVAFQSDEPTESAVLIRKDGGDTLKSAIDKALADLTDEGKLAEISKKYFGEDISKPAS